MADILRAVYWVDGLGLTRLQTLEGNASLATVQSNLLAKSNAGVFRSFEGNRVNVTATPTVAQYPSVNDAAELTYTDGSGNLLRLLLIAPVSSIFLADQNTVDPTQISVLTGSVVGVMLTPAGGVVTSFVSGVRQPTGRSLG